MNETKRKATPKAIDRIVLHPQTAERLNGWLEDLSTRFKGLRLSRTDLANHLLMSRAAVLAPEEAETIRNQYFDEVSFAAWVLKEVRAAKARGQSVSITELYEGMTQSSKSRRPRKAQPAKHSSEDAGALSSTKNGEGQSEVL
jgi:hypothetical protein